MYLAKIVGSVVMTQKIPSLSGKKVMLCHAVDENRQSISGSLKVVVDAVGCGVNDIVLVNQGSTCRDIFEHNSSGIDSVVVGIVDNINIG